MCSRMACSALLSALRTSTPGSCTASYAANSSQSIGVLAPLLLPVLHWLHRERKFSSQIRRFLGLPFQIYIEFSNASYKVNRYHFLHGCLMKPALQRDALSGWALLSSRQRGQELRQPRSELRSHRCMGVLPAVRAAHGAGGNAAKLHRGPCCVGMNPECTY